MSEGHKGFNSTAVHAGFDPKEHHGAVSVPIYQSSTFAFPTAEEGAARFADDSFGPTYTRLGKPTVQALEKCVAELEGGCGAIGTATGMAAVSTVLLAILRQGDHLVGTHPLYGPSRGLVDKYLSRFGIGSTFVPAADGGALAAALRPETRLIYVETPANPTMDLVDLGAAGVVAERAGIPLVVDNTFAGPHLQRPLELGAEIVLHSMTKSLNGHADVVAGIVVARRPGFLAPAVTQPSTSASPWTRTRRGSSCAGSALWAYGSSGPRRTPWTWPPGSSTIGRSPGCATPVCLRTRSTSSHAARCPALAP